jgi:hypothetical protein
MDFSTKLISLKTVRPALNLLLLATLQQNTGFGGTLVYFE